jgi:hypothetical protein
MASVTAHLDPVSQPTPPVASHSGTPNDLGDHHGIARIIAGLGDAGQINPAPMLRGVLSMSSAPRRFRPGRFTREFEYHAWESAGGVRRI